jgi:molecular chaperone GrpE
MEQKNSRSEKPLRTMRDKMQDLYSTYVNREQQGERDSRDSFQAHDTPAQGDTTHETKSSQSRAGQTQFSSNSSQSEHEISMDIPIDIESIPGTQRAGEPVETTKESAGNTRAYGEETATLKEQIQKLQQERDEYREQAIRKVAELENFRRRTEQERKEMLEYANQKLLNTLLPVLDDFERAYQAAKQGNDSGSVLAGIELVFNKTMQTFTDVGVKRMNTVGTMFDVKYHEALMQMPSEAPEGSIVQEVQPGYMLGEKVLRHARVITSAGM